MYRKKGDSPAGALELLAPRPLRVSSPRRRFSAHPFPFFSLHFFISRNKNNSLKHRENTIRLTLAWHLFLIHARENPLLLSFLPSKQFASKKERKRVTATIAKSKQEARATVCKSMPPREMPRERFFLGVRKGTGDSIRDTARRGSEKLTSQDRELFAGHG